MANAMSANTPSANKMLFFVALLMPHASHLCTFVWIVYHADRQKATRFVLFIQRTVTKFGFATENNYKSYPIGGGRKWKITAKM